MAVTTKGEKFKGLNKEQSPEKRKEGGSVKPVWEMDYSERREYIDEQIIPHINEATMLFILSQGELSYDMNDDHKLVIAEIDSHYKDKADYTETSFNNDTAYRVDDWEIVREVYGKYGDNVIDTEEIDLVSQDNTYNWSYNGLVDLDIKLFHDRDYDKYFYLIHPHLGGDIRGNYGQPYILEGDDKDDLFYRLHEDFISGLATINIKFKDGTEVTFESEQDSDQWLFRVEEFTTSGKTNHARKLVRDFEEFKESDADDFLVEIVDRFEALKGDVPKKKDGGTVGDESPEAYIRVVDYPDGKWMALSDYSDGDEFVEGISEWMESLNKEDGGSREEFFVTDWRGFMENKYSIDNMEDSNLSESDFDEVYSAYEAFENSDYPLEVIEEYMSEKGMTDMEDAIRSMDDSFQGQYKDLSDMAYQYVDEGVYTPNAHEMYVTETDIRIISSEEGDALTDGRDFDDLLEMAEMNDEYDSRLEALQEEENELQDQIDSLQAQADDNDGDDYDLIAEEIAEIQEQYDEKREEIHNLSESMYDEVREAAAEKISEETADRLKNDLESYLEELGYENYAEISFVQIDYDKIGEELRADYTIIEYDGKDYVFLAYEKGGKVIKAGTSKLKKYYIIEMNAKKLIEGFNDKKKADAKKKELSKSYPKSRFSVYALNTVNNKYKLDTQNKKHWLSLREIDKSAKVAIKRIKKGSLSTEASKKWSELKDELASLRKRLRTALKKEKKQIQSDIKSIKRDLNHIKNKHYLETGTMAIGGAVKSGAKKVGKGAKKAGSWINKQWEDADFGDGKGKAKFKDGGKVAIYGTDQIVIKDGKPVDDLDTVYDAGDEKLEKRKLKEGESIVSLLDLPKELQNKYNEHWKIKASKSPKIDRYAEFVKITKGRLKGRIGVIYGEGKSASTGKKLFDLKINDGKGWVGRTTVNPDEIETTSFNKELFDDIKKKADRGDLDLQVLVDSIEEKYPKNGKYEKGGEIDSSTITSILEESLTDATEDINSDYELNDWKGEEVETESRDGFIPYTDGGYILTDFSYISSLHGSGYGLPTSALDKELERQVANSYEIAKDEFMSINPELVEELGEDQINYNDLYDSGYGDEAEELSQLEESQLEESVMFQLGAYYYDPENSRSENNKHTVLLYAVVNLESPYHRRGNLEDFKEIKFTFDSLEDLESKLALELPKLVDWFNGEEYESDRELKIVRMAKGGAIAEKSDNWGIEKYHGNHRYTYETDFQSKEEAEKRSTELLDADNDVEQVNVYAYSIDEKSEGGKTQGYNDKLDESLGARDGKESEKLQSLKDRRRESEAMEKAKGKRKYSAVKTMDRTFKKGGQVGDTDVYGQVIPKPKYKKGDTAYLNGKKVTLPQPQWFAYMNEYKYAIKGYPEVVLEYELSDNKESSYARGGETWIQNAVKGMERSGTVGAFTKQAKRHDLTPIEFAKEVLANPDKYIPRTRRRAQFVKNVNPEKFNKGGSTKTDEVLSDGKQLTSYLATAIAEGYENYSKEEDKLKAWAYLQRHKLLSGLDMWIKRTTKDLMETGYFDESGDLNWDMIYSDIAKNEMIALDEIKAEKDKKINEELAVRYSFDQLSEESQQIALESLNDINIDHEWWHNIFKDAEKVGFKIESFDIDYPSESIDADFISNANDTSDLILLHHGADSSTFKLATEFNDKTGKLLNQLDNLNEDQNDHYELSSDIEVELEELDDEFRSDLGREYLKLLKDDFEYRNSEEAVKESIILNAYSFDEYGAQL